MEVKNDPQTLLKTSDGKYLWVPAIQGLFYIPKGRRKPSHSWLLTTKANCYTRALRRAAYLEYERSFKDRRVWA